MPEVDDEKRVHDCLLEVFGDLLKIQQQMKRLEQSLAEDSRADFDRLLHRYGELQEQFLQKGGYEIDAKIRRIASGLQIPHLLQKHWKELSGGKNKIDDKVSSLFDVVIRL